MLFLLCVFFSAPAQGQPPQLQQTSHPTSRVQFCCRTSVCHSWNGPLDVASRVPKDESETKYQPKEEVFGRTSAQTSGQKLRSGPPNPGKTSILAWTARTDVHENFSLKNLRLISRSLIRESPRQTKPKKGPKRKVHELRPSLCEFWCFSLGEQARFTSNFCSGMPPGKFMNRPLVWFAGATPDKCRQKLGHI